MPRMLPWDNPGQRQLYALDKAVNMRKKSGCSI